MNLSDMLKPNLVLSDNSMKEILKSMFFCITILRIFHLHNRIKLTKQAKYILKCGDNSRKHT